MTNAATGRSRLSTHRALASASRIEILDALQRSDVALAVEDVSRLVGLHPNTTREHLDRLVAVGFAASEPEHRGTRGRPRLLYRSVAGSAADGMDGWAHENLLEVLVAGYGSAMASVSAGAEEAGRAWGERLGAAPPPTGQGVGPAPQPRAEGVPDDAVVPEPPSAAVLQLARLEAHLEGLGFDPAADLAEGVVALRRCPFRSLAEHRTEVVCSVHLGLARGVLEASGGPLEATSLEPFAAPGRCVLRLSLREV